MSLPVPPAGERLSWIHPSAISRTRNILWNAPFNLLQAALPLLVVPIYLKLLGAEAYGLIVLNATILATVLFLDRMMGPAIIREFGRRNGDLTQAADMGHLLRSFEWLSVVLGSLVTAGMLVALPFMGGGWTKSQVLDPATLKQAFILMAFSLGLQWPGFLHASGLIGLQRQALASGIRLATAVLLHGGGVLLLVIWGPDIVALLAWQALVFLLQSAVLRQITWRVMPPVQESARFRLESLRGVWRMAAGSLLIGFAAALISQLDKLLVARLSSPEQFTAYGLSFMVAGAVFHVLSGPLVGAMQPHFASLVETGDEKNLAEAYHRWSQVLALFAMPIGGFLMFFSGPLVDLWLGAGSQTGADVKAILPWAALGVMLMALLSPPAVLQGAAGWNGLILGCHTASIVTMLVFMPGIIARHGPTVAAAFGAGLTAMYFVVMVPLMHQRLLRGSFWQAILGDVLLPLGIVAAIFAASAGLSSPGQHTFALLAQGLLTLGGTLALLLLALPHGRLQLADSLRYLRNRST